MQLFPRNLTHAVMNGAAMNLQLSCGHKRTLDLYHASSADLGADGRSVVVALRNANAVVSLPINATGGQAAASAVPLWSLASAMGSSLAFADDDGGGASDFWVPHDATQLPNGDLLLVDDGNTRRGCAGFSPNDDGAEDEYCWSRAVQYRLDTDAGTATLWRQWEAPVPAATAARPATDDAAAPFSLTQEAEDAFNWIGGSFRAIPNSGDERFVLAFSGTVASDYYLAYELSLAHVSVDAIDGSSGSGATEEDRSISCAATVRVPTTHGLGKQGVYRIVPIETVGGESATPTVGVEES